MFFDHTLRTNYRDDFHRCFMLRKTTNKGYDLMTGSFFFGEGGGGGGSSTRLLVLVPGFVLQ